MFGVLRHFVGVLFGNETGFDRLESLGFYRLVIIGRLICLLACFCYVF